LFDFNYFKNIDSIETQIRNNHELYDLDEELSDNYGEILERFYTLFLSIYTYIEDYNKLVSDLLKEKYIQFNIETVLQNPDGKRLISEGDHLIISI
jgi:WASH complex subunit strumpellin